jgi:hypothetical protein
MILPNTGSGHSEVLDLFSHPFRVLGRPNAPSHARIEEDEEEK